MEWLFVCLLYYFRTGHRIISMDIYRNEYGIIIYIARAGGVAKRSRAVPPLIMNINKQATS